ncbi:MAG: hypothetical protein JHC55_13075 [Mycolicibacterium sp.]|nr:hypothetical protein [Mycolicibacterium sp.]
MQNTIAPLLGKPALAFVPQPSSLLGYAFAGEPPPEVSGSLDGEARQDCEPDANADADEGVVAEERAADVAGEDGVRTPRDARNRGVAGDVGRARRVMPAVSVTRSSASRSQSITGAQLRW